MAMMTMIIIMLDTGFEGENIAYIHGFSWGFLAGGATRSGGQASRRAEPTGAVVCSKLGSNHLGTRHPYLIN